MHITNVSVGNDKLCYLLVVDKKLSYPTGRSKIAYIGTTEKGLTRISQSVAAKADEVLAIHGVKAFEARVVTCAPRQNVRTWHKLERAMLLIFRELFGEIPRLNRQGNRIRATNEFDYFAESRIKTILEDIG